MSTTIGIGLCGDVTASFCTRVLSLIEKYGYGWFEGIDQSEPEVRGGLREAKKNRKWDKVFLLQYPVNGDTPLAFGIHKDLVAYEVDNKWPVFFDFLKELSLMASGYGVKASIFFSGEWLEDERVRFSYGSIDDLIFILSLPGNWCIRYLMPDTGVLQDSDEIPFIFEVRR